MQEKGPGDYEYISVTTQAEARNRLQHYLRKTSATPEANRAGKVPDAADTAKTEAAVQRADRFVRLSEVRTITNEALFESKKKVLS